MGWGISIDQDENGCVYCEDADFATGIDDYGDECPPSSYDYIYEMVEDEHGLIDSYRDNSGVDMANEACHDAFRSAKNSYESMDDEDKVEMHYTWVKNTKSELASCVFDPEKEARVLASIEEWNAKNSATMQELESKWKELQNQIRHLETTLTDVRRPKLRKQELENLLKIEDDWFHSIQSDVYETGCR